MAIATMPIAGRRFDSYQDQKRCWSAAFFCLSVGRVGVRRLLAGNANQRTVLIVEDEVLIRMLLADTLVDEGYEVIEAGNVLEAVAILGSGRLTRS